MQHLQIKLEDGMLPGKEISVTALLEGVTKMMA